MTATFRLISTVIAGVVVLGACSVGVSSSGRSVPATTGSINSTASATVVTPSIGLSVTGSSSASRATISTLVPSSFGSAPTARGSSEPVALKPVSVPISVEKSSSGGVVALATVTIHGKPYEFIIDTGASVSVLDEQIASSIGLAHVGKPGQSTGVGCSAPSHPIRLDDWKIGGEVLPTAVVLATKVDLAGEKYKGVTVAGLLGAEVYRAFGSLRLDYKAGSMTLGGNPGARRGSFPWCLPALVARLNSWQR